MLTSPMVAAQRKQQFNPTSTDVCATPRRRRLIALTLLVVLVKLPAAILQIQRHRQKTNNLASVTPGGEDERTWVRTKSCSSWVGWMGPSLGRLWTMDTALSNLALDMVVDEQEVCERDDNDQQLGASVHAIAAIAHPMIHTPAESGTSRFT